MRSRNLGLLRQSGSLQPPYNGGSNRIKDENQSLGGSSTIRHNMGKLENKEKLKEMESTSW